MEYVTSQLVLNEEVIPSLAQCDTIGLDIETRGLDPLKSELLTVQLGTPSQIYVLDARELKLNPVFEILKQTNPLIVGHNLKFDLGFLQYKYEFMPRRLFDTMFAFGIIYNGLELPYISLRELTGRLLNIALDKDIRTSFLSTYGPLSDEQINYAAKDVEYLPQILDKQVARLQRDGLIETAQLEFALIPAIISMERAGIKIDTERWVAAAERLREEADALEVNISEIVGCDAVQTSFLGPDKSMVNPRSNPQMLKALQKLGFAITDTRSSTLSKIEHPLTRALLQYRHKFKLASTYGKNFLRYIGEDGRLHAEFNQLGTVSGRLSSAKPNLQNIPNNESYRQCFITEEDNIMLVADYHQIEYKAAAVMSGEQSILTEYQKRDADFHKLTASKIFNISFDAITSSQRSVGKTCNFGVLFGISKYGMARNFNLSLERSAEFIDAFHKGYPKLAAFMSEQSRLGVANGYTTTKIGRRRYYNIPPLSDPRFNKIINGIRREAANHPVQGTCAEVLKKAIVRLHEALKPYNGKIVNTIHDELVVEVPKQSAAFVVPIIHQEMEAAGTAVLGDRLVWDISLSVGPTWTK